MSIRKIAGVVIAFGVGACVPGFGASIPFPGQVYVQPQPVVVQPAYQVQVQPQAQMYSALPPGATTQRILDENGQAIDIEQGVAGDPAMIGCADGQREGFVDAARHPTVAGCLGQWQGIQTLRSYPTGMPCGDDRGMCNTPADLCAAGWHICGASGNIAEVGNIGAVECENAGAARFSTAISHCDAQSGCVYDLQGGNRDGRYECFPNGWCSEAVCCGRSCGEFGACPDGVWPGATHIARGTDQGCGAMTSLRAGGVLCCHN